MAARCAAMCRAVSQAEIKNANCSWVRALPWRQQTGSGAASSQPTPPASDSFTYGYDSSLRKAYRVKVGGGAKELCS
eukprot:13039022-Alexandrium_andersonii.AAC.1